MRCDKDGLRNVQGNFLWISEMVIAPKYQHKGIIKDIINDIDKRDKFASYIYFLRQKYNRRVRVYPREKFLNFVRGRECSLSLA